MSNDFLKVLDAGRMAAEEKLARELEKVFAGVRVLPDAAIDQVHSYGLAEDQKTLTVIVDLVDGRSLFLAFRPGSAIACKEIA